MTPQTAALMAEYNHWMNQRLYEAASAFDTQELHRNRGAFFGSLFETLMHIAVADTIWLHRFAEQAQELNQQLLGFPRPSSLREQLAGTLAELSGYRRALDAVITQWASGLSAEQLARPLRYTNMAGQAHSKNLGHLVTHFFNHQTHHRGQASTLLCQAGVDMGVTDLIAVIPEAAQPHRQE
ncbi:DinB family protein [Comamonas composti]|uniref:DinB family protein n=1 Tax=Comamonas composti TaxID=408558 RepID=UPI00040785E9|nr:DinB family protein [Comamonas composti]